MTFDTLTLTFDILTLTFDIFPEEFGMVRHCWPHCREEAKRSVSRPSLMRKIIPQMINPKQSETPVGWLQFGFLMLPLLVILIVIIALRSVITYRRYKLNFYADPML